MDRIAPSIVRMHELLGFDPQEQAVEEAVLRHAFEGKPLDPEIVDRVQKCGRRITDEIRRVHGIIDDETFQDLMHDDDEV